MPLPKLTGQKKLTRAYRGFERRNYARFSVDQTLKFRTVNPLFIKEFQIARAKNLSQNGLYFKTVTPPPRKAYILIDINLVKLRQHIEVDDHIVVMQHKAVGKVMRIHLNLETGLFDVGVRFVRPMERENQDIQALLESNP